MSEKSFLYRKRYHTGNPMLRCIIVLTASGRFKNESLPALLWPIAGCHPCDLLIHLCTGPSQWGSPHGERTRVEMAEYFREVWHHGNSLLGVGWRVRREWRCDGRQWEAGGGRQRPCGLLLRFIQLSPKSMALPTGRLLE